MNRLETADLAKSVVSEHFGLDRKHLLHGGRAKVYSGPRHVLAWILRSRGMSYPSVGAEMAGRDHATSINSVRAVNEHEELLNEALIVHAKLELELELAGGLRLLTHSSSLPAPNVAAGCAR